jgi:hypothetical protein
MPECGDCRGPATQKVQWIAGTSAPEKDHYGVILTTYFCDDDFAELVRTTDKRFIVTPLKARPKRTANNGEQMAWEL